MAGGNLFQGQDARSTLSSYLDNIEKEIRKKGSKYVLGVDHDEWLEYFKDTYEIYPLELLETEIRVDYKGRQGRIHRGQAQPPRYVFEISIPFKGHGFLFHLKPSTYSLYTRYGMVLCENFDGVLQHTVELPSEDTTQFHREKDEFLSFVRNNIPNVNRDVFWFNQQVEPKFKSVVQSIVSQNRKEMDFLKELNISIDKETTEVFQVPRLKQKIIKEPIIQKSAISGQVVTIPTVSIEFYEDVCKTISSVFKSVEKKPSIYRPKDEEAFRDYVLPVLETRYEGTTATGETFNMEGKTDILLRYKDGTNLFIAECKIWHGSKLAVEAIDQLFDRYLSWRDSKVALIFFVKEKKFTEIVRKVDEVVKTHKYFVSFNRQIDESSFEYTMHFPGDAEKTVTMRCMNFTFPD